MNKEIAEKIAAAVKSSAQAATDILFKKLDPRIKALEDEKRFTLDDVKKETCKFLEPALNEIKSSAISAISAMVEERVAAIPPAKPGEDGKSVTVDDVSPIIETAVKEAVSAIPAPKDGEDGKSVDMEEVKAIIEAAVKTAFEAMPKPKDGKSVDPEEVKIMVADAVAAIPTPQDGKSVDMKEVEAMLQGMVNKAVSAVEIPKPSDGRDALDIEILSDIDEKKSYPRGTYATHRGGLWKAWQKTEGMSGWECIVDGIFKTVVNQSDDRNFSFIAEKSSGAIVKLPFKVPAMIYKNVYVDGKEYDEGDTVTWGGSVWYCNKKTTDKPGDGSQSWTLAVKRGRDSNPKVKI